MNDTTAKLLLEEEKYENGANCPTVHKEYACPCGQGTIVEARVPAFGTGIQQQSAKLAPTSSTLCAAAATFGN